MHHPSKGTEGGESMTSEILFLFSLGMTSGIIAYWLGEKWFIKTRNPITRAIPYTILVLLTIVVTTLS